MKLFKNFGNVRKELLVLLALALVTHFLIELVFNNYSEIFSGGHVFGKFFSGLSISYIAGFIFYFIVVHLKNEKDKENINEFVGQQVHAILTSAHLMIVCFQRKSEPKAQFQYFNPDKLRELLGTIERFEPEAPYIINGKNINWVEWYEYLKKSTLKSVSEIFARYNHVDSELIKLVTRIENSTMFRQIDMLYRQDGDSTFRMYEFQISTYLNLIKELEKYAEENLSEHEYRHHEFLGIKRENYGYL